MAKKYKGAHGVRIIVDFHHAPIAFGANQIRARPAQKSKAKSEIEVGIQKK